jgi:uncharacterized protein (TIGR04222 family)
VNDTWGISGPRFLVIYSVLLVLAGLAVLLGRRVLAGSPATMPVGAGELDPYDVAMLTGGERHAATTAIFQLNHAGVLAVGEDPPAVTPSGPIPSSAHPVEQAVYKRAVAAGGSPHVILSDAEQTPVLAALRDRLVQRGLLVRPEQARKARALVAVPAAVLLLGLARLVAGLSNGKPVIYLLVLLGATFWVARLAWRPLRLTPEGNATLRQLRRRGATQALLPAGQAFTVALLGASALWGVDAGLAGALGIPRQSSGSSDGSSGCGGGDGGGGGGCGG